MADIDTAGCLLDFSSRQMVDRANEPVEDYRGRNNAWCTFLLQHGPHSGAALQGNDTAQADTVSRQAIDCLDRGLVPDLDLDLDQRLKMHTGCKLCIASWLAAFSWPTSLAISTGQPGYIEAPVWPEQFHSTMFQNRSSRLALVDLW